MNLVNGTNVMLYYHDEGTNTDIPFACAKNCAMSINPSFRDVTSATSAFAKQVIPDIYEWSVSIDGLVTLSNYGYLFLTDLITSRLSILIKFVVDNGPDGLVIYSGQAYPGQFTLTGNYNEAAMYQVTMMGTGAYNSTGTTITPSGVVIEGGTVTRFEYTVPSDGATITIAATIGASAITVFARGTAGEPTIKYTGSPTGDEIKFTTGTGTFEAASDTPFLAGEKISGSFN